VESVLTMNEQCSKIAIVLPLRVLFHPTGKNTGTCLRRMGPRAIHPD
jgi:hypothetical protein